MKKLICTLGIIFGVAQVWAMQEEGGEPPFKMVKLDGSGANTSMSDMEYGVEETTANSHDKRIESHSKAYYNATTFSELACEAIVNKDKVRSLIKALSNDSLSADIIEKVFWDLQRRKHDYAERYYDFMEISDLLYMVSHEKCEGYCVEEQSLLDSYNRGEFKVLETGGPLDEFEPDDAMSDSSDIGSTDRPTCKKRKLPQGEIIPDSEVNSSGEYGVEETTANSHDKWIESHASLISKACYDAGAFCELLDEISAASDSTDEMKSLYESVEFTWNDENDFEAIVVGNDFCSYRRDRF